MGVNEVKTQGKEKALEEALKKIEKDFGKGAIMKLGERPEQKTSVVSSGGSIAKFSK